MTTYTKDTEYGRKYATYLYLIYRVEAGELKRYGLFETREGAERELAMINRKIPRWKIADGATGSSRIASYRRLLPSWVAKW